MFLRPELLGVDSAKVFLRPNKSLSVSQAEQEPFMCYVKGR